MARAQQRTARKDYPDDGIRKGETYWTWKLRHGPVRRSKEKPLPEQLTGSEYLQQWYPLNRQVQEFEGSADDLEGLASEARELGEGQQESLDAMPEGLQEGSTGELLQERIEECNELADTLEAAQTDLEAAEKGEGDESVQDILDRVKELALA